MIVGYIYNGKSSIRHAATTNPGLAKESPDQPNVTPTIAYLTVVIFRFPHHAGIFNRQKKVSHAPPLIRISFHNSPRRRAIHSLMRR